MKFSEELQDLIKAIEFNHLMLTEAHKSEKILDDISKSIERKDNFMDLPWSVVEGKLKNSKGEDVNTEEHLPFICNMVNRSQIFETLSGNLSQENKNLLLSMVNIMVFLESKSSLFTEKERADIEAINNALFKKATT